MGKIKRTRRGRKPRAGADLVNAPLRKIVATREVVINPESLWRVTRLYEVLECGHEQPIREDFYGKTNAYQRRCRVCLLKMLSDNIQTGSDESQPKI